MHEADEKKWDEQSVASSGNLPDRFPTDRPWPSDSRAKIKQKAYKHTCPKRLSALVFTTARHCFCGRSPCEKAAV